MSTVKAFSNFNQLSDPSVSHQTFGWFTQTLSQHVQTTSPTRGVTLEFREVNRTQNDYTPVKIRRSRARFSTTAASSQVRASLGAIFKRPGRSQVLVNIRYHVPRLTKAASGTRLWLLAIPFDYKCFLACPRGRRASPSASSSARVARSRRYFYDPVFIVHSSLHSHRVSCMLERGKLSAGASKPLLRSASAVPGLP